MKACVAGILAVVLCALALGGCEDDPDGAPVEARVVRAYRAYGHYRPMAADCAYADMNEDGSEWWWCDVETNDPLGFDTCSVDARRRAGGAVTVRMRYCVGVDGP